MEENGLYCLMHLFTMFSNFFYLHAILKRKRAVTLGDFKTSLAFEIRGEEIISRTVVEQAPGARLEK